MANQEQKLWNKAGEGGVRPVRTFTATSLWKLDQASDEGGAVVTPRLDWKKDHGECTRTRRASPHQVDSEHRVNEAEGERGENGDSDDEFDGEDEEDCLVVTMEDSEQIFDFEEPNNHKLLSTPRYLAPTEGLGYQETPVATSTPCSALSRAQIGRQLVREWLDRQGINVYADANKSRPPLGKSRSRRSHIRTFSAGTLQALKGKLGSHTRHGRSSSSISTSSFTSIASISTAASTSSSVSSSTSLSNSGPASPHSASFHSLSWALSSNSNRGIGSNPKLGNDSALSGPSKDSHILTRDLHSHAKEQEPLKRRGSTASLVTHQNSCCPGHEARETKRFSWLLRRRYKCDMAESNIGNLLFLLMWYPQLSVELLTMQFADLSLKRSMCQLLVAKLLANPSRKRPQRLTLQCILWNLLKHQFSIDRHQPLQSNSSAASFLSSVLHEPSCSQALLDRINPILDTVCGSAYDALLQRGEAAQHESAALVASRLLVVLEENRSTLFPEVVYSICAQVDLLVKHYGLERTAVVGGQLFCLRFLNRLIISHAGAGKRNVVLCKVASLLQALCGAERNSVVEPVTQLPEVANFFATGRSRMRAFVDSLCLHAPPAATYAEMLFKMEEIEVALDLERCLFQATSEQAYTGPIILLTPADIQILVQSILLLADAHSDAYGRAMLQAYTQPRIRHLQSLVSTRRTNREECSHLDFRPAFIYFPPLCVSHSSFPVATGSSDPAGPLPRPSTGQVPVIPETFVSRLRLAVIDISNQATFQSNSLVSGEYNRPLPETAPFP